MLFDYCDFWYDKKNKVYYKITMTKNHHNVKKLSESYLTGYIILQYVWNMEKEKNICLYSLCMR